MAIESRRTARDSHGRARYWLLVQCLALLAVADSAQAQLSREITEPRPENGYWSVGKPRWFASTRSEFGFVYAKPYFSAGYGMPHWLWVGLDVNAITTLDMGQVTAGARIATPVAELSLQLRDTLSYGKPFLDPKDSYSRSDVLDAPGKKAHYSGFEGELATVAPLPHAAIVVSLIMVKIFNPPPDKYIYEENYRLVIKDPLYFVFRVAAVARFLRENALKVGVLTEYGFHTGRESPVFRVGPVAAIAITDHLQLQAGFALAVSSPDRLGLTLGANGVGGFRYNWATEERRPELPWAGHVIP